VPIESTPALHPPRRAEIVLFFAFIALLASALLLPAIHQDPSYHRFADQRTWLGVPHAANVLSNLAFIAVGLFGSFTLLSSHRVTRAAVTSLWRVAAGFVLTGIGGGLAALVILLVATHAESDPFSWAWSVGWYCFAKAADLGDSLVWQWSGGIVPGHTIKHLAAAATGAAMFYPLQRPTAPRPRCPTAF